MGSLVSRLSRLEAAQKQEQARLGREVLSHLSDEDLDALEDALEAGQENGTATFEDLYRVSSEQSVGRWRVTSKCSRTYERAESRTSLPKPERRKEERPATVIASGSSSRSASQSWRWH